MEDTKMKTKVLTTVLILALIVLTSKTTIAEGKNVNASNSQATEQVNVNFEESAIEIEEWMYTEYFNSNIINEEYEESLDIESWMIEVMETYEVEEELEIEDWMSKVMEVENFNSVDEEPELEIEAWMVQF